MAVKQIGVIACGNIKEYQCSTTDAVNTYPTDCGAGSTMIVIDEVAHKIANTLYFDGTTWNTI